MKKLFKINGIKNLGCKLKIEKSLNKLHAVEAELNIQTQIATIQMPKYMEKYVLKKIKKMDYDAIEI